MKKFLTATALAGAAAIAAVPSGAGAQESATVSLMHGIPGVTVDVVVDGAVVIPGFEPGTMQDLSSFAGDTLSNVEVRGAGSDDVVIGPIESLPVPDSGNWTVVAHLGADGTPTLTPFQNDVSSIDDGQGRLTVRHAAAPSRRHHLGRRVPPLHEPLQPERGRRRPAGRPDQRCPDRPDRW